MKLIVLGTRWGLELGSLIINRINSLNDTDHGSPNSFGLCILCLIWITFDIWMEIIWKNKNLYICISWHSSLCIMCIFLFQFFNLNRWRISSHGRILSFSESSQKEGSQTGCQKWYYRTRSVTSTEYITLEMNVKKN